MNYKNKKNGKIYTVLAEDIINSTNSNDGQRMILYTDNNGNLYVREYSEFMVKFDKCTDKIGILKVLIKWWSIFMRYQRANMGK